MFRIETQRLILKPVTMENLPEMAELWSDPDVFLGFGRDQPHTPDEMCMVMKYMVKHWQEFNFGTFSISLKDTGAFIGYCELEVFQPGCDEPHAQVEEMAVELAYALSTAQWGQGYATEAASAVMRFAFEAAKIPSIFAAAGESNLASQRVMLSIGMIRMAEDNYYPNCPNFMIERDHFSPQDSTYLLTDE